MLQMNREDRWTVMGVFDGHGKWGGKVASAVRHGMVRAMKDVDGRKMNGSLCGSRASASDAEMSG